MKTIIISSNCSGSGKTTFTLGLMKALMNRNYDIQGFKVGPDYIDTGFHTEITGKASRNLDIHLMGEEGVKASFSRGKGDLAVVEGVMGLYDGKGLDTDGSTYNISKVLDNAPILLVITPKAQSVTLCAEINGIKDFRDANIVGVILNNISESYYEILKAAIEKNCDTKVFGYIPKNEDIKLESRYLGLIQSVEVKNLKNKIEVCAELVEKYVNLDELIGYFKDTHMIKDNFHLTNQNKRIAVAYDEAFRFYYKENLELLEELGEVIYFSPLKDKGLPKDIDFLYIGGGYPEVFKDSLRENKTMLYSIKNALENGLYCYGECGGLMYLTEKIDDVPMVGFFSGKSEMTKTLNRFGYATIDVDGIKINCHEFHKSKTISQENAIYRVEKVGYLGEAKVWSCGFKKFNTLAGYPHVHFFGNMDFLFYIINGKGGIDMSYIVNPMEIENTSMKIIESEMGEHNFTDEELKIVKRLIHTTADFEYKDLVEISSGAIDVAKEILKSSPLIYTDTNMALSGINKMALAKLSGKAICYVNLEEVHKEAKEKGITRSMAAVEKACSDNVDIFVFGNAPTALFRLKELIKEGKANPKLIVAVPVGFVGAAESKENLEELNIPYIAIRGRKGGSTVAAAIINAMMYMVVER